MPSSSAVKIFHLEMCHQDDFRPSDSRSGLVLEVVEPADPEFNRRFYRSVGALWNWTDRLSWSLDTWQKYLARDGVLTFVGRLNGEELGFVELEAQAGGSVEIVYFGLLPEFIGQGLGGALLSAAVGRAWEVRDTKRVWVHTCSQDHENALSNYLARGFELFRTEEEEPLGEAGNIPTL
jgi:GNAT superfamily N-acetyltransferase